MNLLTLTWQGNTVQQWIIVAAIILVIPIVVRTLDAVLRWQARSPTGTPSGFRWVTAIAASVRKPITTLIWLAGLWVITRHVLVLPDWLRVWAVRFSYGSFMFGLGWLLARLSDAAVDGLLTRAAERKGVSSDGLLKPLFRSIAGILVWSVVLVLGLDNAGYKLSAILGGLGLGGLAIAMAAKELISDLLGGVTIMLNRPFAVGDKIMFKGQWATVLSFELRTTTLRDFATNHKYVVPNSYFTHNEVTNISDHPGNMILMNIRLSLTCSADQVAKSLALVQDILKGHAEIRYIWSKLDHFDEYASTLRIHYDILEFRHRIRVKSEINLAILRAFQDNGIKFAAMPVNTVSAQAESSPFVG